MTGFLLFTTGLLAGSAITCIVTYLVVLLPTMRKARAALSAAQSAMDEAIVMMDVMERVGVLRDLDFRRIGRDQGAGSQQDAHGHTT